MVETQAEHEYMPCNCEYAEPGKPHCSDCGAPMYHSIHGVRLVYPPESHAYVYIGFNHDGSELILACGACGKSKEHEIHSTKNTPSNGNQSEKKVNMKKPDFTRMWDRLCEELEERPVVVLGLFSTVVYGASQIMDSNTRRANAKTDRKRLKTYDKEVERRIRQEKKK